jgi:hypothetical protein
MLKPGFTKGAHGRKAKASWGRRNRYLASEQDREGVWLYGRDEGGVRELSRSESLAELGGKNAQYRETIIAFSETECRALEERALGDKLEAQRLAAQDMGERLAGDKPYVVAVHEEQGRWHLHVAVMDEERPRLYGPRGEAQKAFDDFWRASSPRTRILDWDAHLRSKALQGDLRNISQQLQQVEHTRLEVLRQTHGAHGKQAISREFDGQARALIGQRFRAELENIEARHQARGTRGGWEQQVECERADIRRICQENRIQRREERLQARVDGRENPALSAARRTDRPLAKGREAIIRGTQRAISLAEGVATKVVDAALQQTGMPQEARLVALSGIKITAAAAHAINRMAAQVLRSSTRMARVSAPAVARQACHAAKVTMQVSVGVALPIPTGGVSLKAAANESIRDLGAAGKDLAKDGGEFLKSVSQEVAKMARNALDSAGSQGVGLLPRAAAQAVGTAIEAGKTVANTATHALRLDVVGAASSVLQGTAKAAEKAVGLVIQAKSLPAPIRLASNVLEMIPIAGSVLTVARKSTELALGAAHGLQGLTKEVER